MSSQKSTQMSIQQAASYFGVAEKTIRRRIKSGKLKAIKRGGRFFVQVVLDSDQTPVHPSVQSNRPPSIEALEQLRSENKHLRQLLAQSKTQIDQLSQLLAMQTKQNSDLVTKLPPPRVPFGTRLRPLLVHLRLAAPR